MTDEDYMREVFKEVEKASAEGEAPFGVVVVDAATGEIIHRDYPSVNRDKDPTAHGEINAIRALCEKRGDPKSLGDTIFYTNAMPCITCYSAMVKARVPKVVYAAPTEKTNPIKFTIEELNEYTEKHKMEIISGVLADEALRQRLQLGGDE